jgi:hypothetical protein
VPIVFSVLRKKAALSINNRDCMTDWTEDLRITSLES